MGMYNEVYKYHDGCGGIGYMQVPQVVYGFGSFNLNDINDLAERLSEEQLQELYQEVVGRSLSCHKCQRTFPLFPDKEELNKRRALAEELFGDPREEII